MTAQARTPAGVPTGGQFAASTRTEAAVALTAPAAPHYDTLEDLAAAGYVTDEWQRWQQGGCAAYAIALVDAHPHLRFAVLGRTELGGGDASGGWRETHCFAHDDAYAYDSAGRHPLPYRGIEGDNDYAELDSDPDWFGYRDEFDEADYAAAREHATRHRILDRDPVPLGGAAMLDGSGDDERAVVLLDSRHEEVEILPGVIEENAEYVYTNGQCAALAIEIAERTGWPLHVRTIAGGEGRTYLRHVAVLTPAGDLLDIDGPNDAQIAREMDEDFGDAGEPEIVPADRARTILDRFSVPPQDFETARSFVDPVLALNVSGLAWTDLPR